MEKKKTYLEPVCKAIVLHTATNLLQTSSPDMQNGNNFNWGDKDLWE